ncbi:MAG: YfiR family protein [Verrucomicrobiota bacterium]
MKARTLTLLLIVALACGPTTPTSNQAATNDFALAELQVKAGFLYNFALFTTWPTNVLNGSTNAIRIGVLGQDSFGPILEQMLRDKRVDKHPVEIRRYTDAAAARDCQVLYISCSETGRLPAVLGELGNAPVLTVGDMPGFAEQGGMIALVKTNDRVAFNVNLSAARQAKLSISSKLLRLALKIVEPIPASVSP